MDSLRSTAKGVIVIGGALLAVALGAVIALAWAANGSAAGVSSAATVPRGQQPSGTVSGNTVSLTWGASTLPDGTPVDGYIVKRYPNGGATPVMTSSLVASASFTDSNVPPGTWQYSDTPMKAGWPGAESPVSAPLTVAPAITLSPGSGSPGTVLSVSGSSFNSSAPLTFTFSGSAVSTTPSAPATDAGGGFSGVTFTVPGDPAGTYTLKVADGGGAYATASFAITPSIQLSPVSGFVRSSASVSGNGFAAGSALTATYDGSALTLSGTTTTDTTGAFSGMTFTVPPSTAGDHTIAVTDHSGNSASASFTVNPAVKLSPTSGPAGTTVTVQGGGFSPPAAISTTFFGGAVATTPASPATDANGSFSLTFNVPNYSASSVDYAVAETDAQGFTASAGFMITGASLTFSPAAGVAGQALTISGASWPASSTVAVYIGPGSTNLLCSVSTDASGNIVTTGQSCPAPTNLVAGTYPISGALGSVDVIARAKFTLKPTIKLYTSSADTTVMTRARPATPSTSPGTDSPPARRLASRSARSS